MHRVVGTLPALALVGCATVPLRPEPDVRWCGEETTPPALVEDYDQAPRPIRTTQPRYPDEAYRRKIQGVVVLGAVIAPTGQVLGAWVTKSIAVLDEAALDCVCEWSFEPAVKDGEPVATLARVPVSFKIFKKEPPQTADLGRRDDAEQRAASHIHPRPCGPPSDPATSRR